MRRPSFPRLPSRIAWSLAMGIVLASCTAGPTAPSVAAPATTGAPDTPAPEPSRDVWADDLHTIDLTVRLSHPSPFAIHSEAEWESRLAEVSAQIRTASPNEQITLVASLLGLLDTHSAFVTVPGGWHYYGLLPYRFADGWFIVRARAEHLVGDRLVSIGGTPIDDVERILEPLIPHDNGNGLLEGLVWVIESVEFLNGAGIVADPAHPAFELEKPDGTRLTVDPPVLDEATFPGELFPTGWLQGAAPEAVARRGERIWTRLDEANRVFLISVNDYGDMAAAGAAMTAALDAGQADRVVLDMRYLQGGNGDIAIVETLRDDPRVNRPGGLIALIGRENVSAGTQVVAFLEAETEALLVGESTPARADNFRCQCMDVTLEHSGFVISVPTYWGRTGDDRPEIAPDIPLALSSTDFFAGRDPVLDAALAGTLASRSP